MTDETIFATALEQADPAARAAYLTEACAGDPDCRRRVEGLLAAHEKASGFLEKPPVPPADPARMPTQDLSASETDPSEPDDALTFLTPPRRPDSLGRIGHYEVLEVLGKGGFGIVFRAFDETLQRVVAIKVLAPQLAATSPARKRFLREARSSAKVRHENVVQVYAVEEQPLPYLVMEFIPGETLQQRLDRTGPLETAEVLQIGRQIAEGLAAAHAHGPDSPRHQAGQHPDRGRSAPARQDHRLRPGPCGRRRQLDPVRDRRRDADVHGPGTGARRHARPSGRPVQPRQRALHDVQRPAAVPGQ